ncbi:MAG: hypothetical protein KDI55_22210, partial [Anaerolineae bacterium]|nr:hypothetical protein [Anaerolineae bacterium]
AKRHNTMTRFLEQDTNTNIDISSATAIGSYTADTDRLILCQFFVDQAVGNGDYEFYLTQQIGGSGSSYRYVPKTTATVASGVTAIAGQSIMVAVRSGDVLTAYLDGLAGDTTTPDTTVRWFEMAALRPTVADRTLDVASTGEAGMDFDNRLDTNAILPSDTAGSLGGLPLLDVNSLLPADVKRWDANNMTGTLPALAGADGDTLETLSDQIDALPTAAQNRSEMDSNSTQLAAIVADTGELQTDWVNGGRLDLLVDGIKAKTDNLPASPAAVGSAMTLTAAYDAAKTAASQTSVDDIPTNAELASSLAGLNDLDSTEAQAAAAAALTAYDPPTNAEMVARTLVAAAYFDPATDTVAHVTLVDTTTTNTDMVSAAPSAAAIRAEIDANSTQLAAIVADTNELQTNQGDWATADVSSLATAAELAKVPKSDGSASWNATALAAINAQADTALADYDPPTHAELLSALSGGISVEVDAQTVADAMAVATTDTPAANSVLDRLINIQSTTDQIDLTDINYVSNIQSGTLNMTRGVTFEQEITGVTIPSDWASIVLRCKRKSDTIDGQDQIAIVVTNPSAVNDGLTVLGGTAVASPITKADGSLTIDQPGSSITIMVSDEATDELGITANGIWDVKITDGDGDTAQRARGVFNLALI